MLESLLASYGYPIVLLGTFLEGETVMVLAGVAAHMGYLSLDWVIACGFCGTYIGDQLYFYLGRKHGKTMLARHPAWHCARGSRIQNPRASPAVAHPGFPFSLRAALCYPVCDRHEQSVLCAFRRAQSYRGICLGAVYRLCGILFWPRRRSGAWKYQAL